MKDTKENLEILKKLGFKIYKDSYGILEAQLPNGWGITVKNIRSFKWLINRLYVGQAENCMYNGDIYSDKKGYYCIGCQKKNIKTLNKRVYKSSCSAP